RREDAGGLVHGERAVAPVGRGRNAQPALHLRGRERALLVAGREPLPLGQDPDLEKVHGLDARRVVLAVRDAGAGGHALHLAGVDDGPGPQAVLVLERALDDVGDDLHVAVAMGGEACARLHPVLVDDAQAAEAHVARVEVVGEREGVAARKPAELRAAALGARTEVGASVSPASTAGNIDSKRSSRSSRPGAASPAFCSNALPMADAISGPASARSIWSSARRTESVPSTAPASVAGRSR